MNPKRIFHQIRNAERTLSAYQGNEPFSQFLAKFYKQNRQMGSTDRRFNSRYCYNLFRLGNAFQDLDLEQRLCVAEFLCENESLLLDGIKPELAKKIHLPVSDKIELIESEYGNFLPQVFPFQSRISEQINPEFFVVSHFTQPDLFIRVKRGQQKFVEGKLKSLDIAFEKIDDTAYRLANGTNLHVFKNHEQYFEVQDLSSQRTAQFLSVSEQSSWWDCCAASGGKSLMLLDKYPAVKLLVSDIRLTIIRNLIVRFNLAGVKVPRTKIFDLSQPVTHLLGDESFDGILLDAPCSGSGTWGRTPERMTQFREEEIESYSTLQKKIAANAIPFLKPKGQLVYITCSVYKTENEDVADYLKHTFELTLVRQQYLIGHPEKADTMFVAVFEKK